MSDLTEWIKERRRIHDRGQCRQCNTFDPIHAKRSRRRNRGTNRPASIADVMHCPNCGHEWVERTLTRPGAGATTMNAKSRQQVRREFNNRLRPKIERAWILALSAWQTGHARVEYGRPWQDHAKDPRAITQEPRP